MVLKKDLNNLRYYITEKERLIKEIDDLSSKVSDGYKSLEYDKSPTKNASNNNTTLNLVMHNSKIIDTIKKREKKLEITIIKLYKIIEKIDNAELKTIVELRAIKGMTFRDIGEEVHMDFSWVRKKYNDFINEN